MYANYSHQQQQRRRCRQASSIKNSSVLCYVARKQKPIFVTYFRRCRKISSAEARQRTSDEDEDGNLASVCV